MSIQKTYPLDIETVPIVNNVIELKVDLYNVFVKKLKKEIQETFDNIDDPNNSFTYEQKVEASIADTWKNKAALHPEFGKIVCCCIGVIDDALQMKIVTFASEDEKSILTNIVRAIDKGAPKYILTHNGKGFDVPFIFKRLIINAMDVPMMLRIMGKKPWEIPQIIDTQELWALGDFKNHTSLAMIAAAMGFESPKEEMNGQAMLSSVNIMPL
jgi:hypothetical protein